MSVKSWRGGCKLQFRLKTRSLDFRLNSSFFAAKGCEDVLAWLHHTEMDERGRDPKFSGVPKWLSENLQPRKPSQPIKTCWYIYIYIFWLEPLKTGYLDPKLIFLIWRTSIYAEHLIFACSSWISLVLVCPPVSLGCLRVSILHPMHQGCCITHV